MQVDAVAALVVVVLDRAEHLAPRSERALLHSLGRDLARHAQLLGLLALARCGAEEGGPALVRRAARWRGREERRPVGLVRLEGDEERRRRREAGPSRRRRLVLLEGRERGARRVERGGRRGAVEVGRREGAEDAAERGGRGVRERGRGRRRVGGGEDEGRRGERAADAVEGGEDVGDDAVACDEVEEER